MFVQYLYVKVLALNKNQTPPPIAYMSSSRTGFELPKRENDATTADRRNARRGKQAATFDDLYRIGGESLHQKSRAKSRASHINFLKDVNPLNKENIRRRIHKYYDEAQNGKHKFSYRYLQSVLSTMKAVYKTDIFGKWELNLFVKNLNKIYNKENKDKTFFTSDGSEQYDFSGLVAKVNINKIDNLQESLSELIGANKNDIEKTELYTEVDEHRIKNYYHERLKIFLASPKTNRPTRHDELALLIVFMHYSPKRINEIITLTMEKTIDLIWRQNTSIKSKNGGGTADIIVPIALSTYLQSFIDHKSESCTNLFEFDYNALYYLYTHELKDLFGLKISRLFHGYRNMFTFKHISQNPSLVQQVLDHRRFRTTASYAKKQENQLKKENVYDKVKEYLNNLMNENDLI